MPTLDRNSADNDYMQGLAKVKTIDVPCGSRIIAISDIHGELDLLQALLEKVGFSDSDTLILLGDLYLKGSKPQETLAYCIQLSQLPNVHILRGNCDWPLESYITPAIVEWLEQLPHIITAGWYTFVHAGIDSGDLHGQLAHTCMRYADFVGQGPAFDEWVIVGHYAVSSYHSQVPSFRPYICHEKKIINIDGGCALRVGGQLNALLIQDGQFDHTYVDSYPTVTFDTNQAESGGNIHLGFLNRHVQVLERGNPFSQVRHTATGYTLTVPTDHIWTDNTGQSCITVMATDYHIPYQAGQPVQLVKQFPDRAYVKHNDTLGWLRLA